MKKKKVDRCLAFLRQALNQGNINLLCQTLTTFFAEIPSIMHSHFENYYQFSLLGATSGIPVYNENTARHSLLNLFLEDRLATVGQSIIFAIIKTARFETHLEDQTNLGHIDMTIITTDLIYVIELKTRGSAQEVLQQIKEKQYAQKYFMSSKKIILVGIFIDIKKRNIQE